MAPPLRGADFSYHPLNGHNLVRFRRPALFSTLGVMMEYHPGEEAGRGRGRGMCGLLVKVVLVGAVYDTLPVGCKAAIHSG